MRVVVGLSGGVDSSVACLLLKEQGYEVIPVFMRNWDSTLNNDTLGNPDLELEICAQEIDYLDALKVCEDLDLKLHRVDFIEEYWNLVFTHFLEELKNGRTPNPDILCNKYIKFKAFIEFAEKFNCDFIATGHYAQIENNKLKKSVDANKDQTYFLDQINKEILKKVIFPLGKLTKPEVREIAKKNNLYTANKKDSTGICFIGERDFKDFLKNYLPAQEGNIVNIINNEIVGIHYGLMNYTLGQRKGLNIGGAGDAWFVVKKELATNTLFVAQGQESDFLLSKKALIKNVNWLVDKPKNDFSCFAKFRYRQVDNEVNVIMLENGDIEVSYPQLIKAVTEGQECVLYDFEGFCLGGGVIDEVFK